MFNNKIEVLVNLFTFDKGEIKVLLLKKQEEPYKGYWMLPSNLMINTETLDECVDSTVKQKVGIPIVYKEVCDVFSNIDRIPETRIVGISVMGILSNTKLKTKEEYQWFNINNLPKTIYDNEIIITKTVEKLKKELLNTRLLKMFFPINFTLPELQKLYEQILNKSLDRRNFRKRILKIDILEKTNEKNSSTTGRPALLYNFKDIEDRNLF